MNSHSPSPAGVSIAPLSVEMQIVKSRLTGICPATAYTLLLGNPMTVLAGHVADRPDVQSVAILGYN